MEPSPTATLPASLQSNEGFQQSPGYQFQLQQGLQGVNQSAAAQGLLGSGAQGQALTQYGQNYAAGYYQNYLNQLNTAAGVGATASGQLANAATSGSNTLQGASTTAGGQASAANLQTGKEQGALLGGNLSLPQINTNYIGLGTSNI